MKNPYETLGLTKTATEQDIKKAFKELSLKYHPDRPTGDEEKFKEISEAYNILSSKEKKAEYDGASNFSDSFSNMDSMFREMFGSRSKPKKSIEDVQVSITLTLKEFYVGTVKEISFLRKDTCVSCDGAGYEVTSCSGCHGTGWITQQQGPMTLRSTCRFCFGAGTTQAKGKKCTTCSGTGGSEALVKEKINLPPGSGHLHETRMMNLFGKGHTHSKYGKGHVKVFITIESDDLYSQSGLDLIYRQSITFSDLCLGVTIDVPLPDDSVASITISPGTHPDQILRVKGKGIRQPTYRQVGDLLLELNLNVPKNLTEEQKTLLLDLKSKGI